MIFWRLNRAIEVAYIEIFRQLFVTHNSLTLEIPPSIANLKGSLNGLRINLRGDRCVSCEIVDKHFGQKNILSIMRLLIVENGNGVKSFLTRNR